MKASMHPFKCLKGISNNNKNMLVVGNMWEGVMGYIRRLKNFTRLTLGMSIETIAGGCLYTLL